MANIIKIIPQCDCCHETNPSYMNDTECKVLASIKRDGWIVKNDVFLCPDCIDSGFQISKGSIVRKSN